MPTGLLKAINTKSLSVLASTGYGARFAPTLPSVPVSLWASGETEEDFQFLLDWLVEAQLDRVGCFKYEPATPVVEHVLLKAPLSSASQMQVRCLHRLPAPCLKPVLQRAGLLHLCLMLRGQAVLPSSIGQP